VAWDLGTCGGHPAYRKFEWYFPRYDGGGHPPSGSYFSPRHAMDVCSTDTSHGQKARQVTWDAPAALDPGAEVTSVSCASASYCVAVDAGGDVLSWDGAQWSTAATSDDRLESVSCTQTSYCATVGYDGDGGSFLSYGGAGWSSPESLDPGYKLHSISCATSAYCELGAAVNVFSIENGVGSEPIAIDQSNNDTSESGYGLPSMSCPREGFCATVDGSGNAFVMNGSTWSAPESIDPNVQLDSVSCVSAGLCVAVDEEGNAFIYRGSSWSAADPVDPKAAIGSVSCASGKLCVAVDSDGDSLTFDGRDWSRPGQADPGHGLVAVSCPTVEFCMAVDDEGDYVVGR
jgi:hypothetical protein